MAKRPSSSRLFNELARATSEESAEELLDVLAPLRRDAVATIDDLLKVLEVGTTRHERTFANLRRLRDETSQVVRQLQRQLNEQRLELIELRGELRSGSWRRR
jgi:molecular chaperone GrpE (heat shock protein)